MKQNPLRLIGLSAAAAVFMSGAQAQSIDSLLMRNARQQSLIHEALLSSRMDPIRAAQVQERAAEAYRTQAQMLPDPTDEELEQMRQAQRDLAGAIAWAEKHPARDQADPMDRTRLQGASTRTAEQQRLIARGLAEGRLTKEQVAALQTVQAQIVTEQAEAAVGGDYTFEEARSVEGAQNVQEYSIKKDPDLARLWSLPGENAPLQSRND
jgi:hypothetical protein